MNSTYATRIPRLTCCYLSAIVVQLVFIQPKLTAVTFDTNAVISESNTVFDGQDIVVNGATLTVDGRHSFRSLLLTNEAVLTCPLSTTNRMHKLEINVAGTISVSTNSRIDVSGKGYLPGYTRGNTTLGAATFDSGGSYGGWGLEQNGTTCALYGNYVLPEEPGSGSGAGGVAEGAAGGGLAQITAEQLYLDGELLANGASTAGGGNRGNGGSGGGILVKVSSLSGKGFIRSKGGDGGTSRLGGLGSPGGGGRVAVYAEHFTEFDPTHISAPPGAGFRGGEFFASAGTVYLRGNNEPFGTLVLDAAGAGGNWIPLGLPGTNHLVFQDVVVVRGNRTTVRLEHPGMLVTFEKSLVVTNGARLELENAVFNGANPLKVGDGGLVQVTGMLTSATPVVVEGGTVAADRIIAPQLLLTNGAVLTHAACTATDTHQLDVRVSGTLVVSEDSRIDVSGKGYLPGRTLGNTTNGASTFNSGGSYGGLGLEQNGTTCALYGNYFLPEESGSGSGAGGVAEGAAGGGLAQITAEQLYLDGELLANGASTAGGGNRGNGGSGGGILVKVSSLSGKGFIRSKGGDGGSSRHGGLGSPGGGGRVAVYAEHFTEFEPTHISAPGGAGPQGGEFFASAGTVYLRGNNEPFGTLVLDAAGAGGNWIPLGLPGTNHLVFQDVVVVRGNRTTVRLEHPGMLVTFEKSLVVTNGARLELENAVFNGANPLKVGDGGLVQVTGMLTSATPVVVEGGTVAADRVIAPQLLLTNGAVLTHAACTATDTHQLDVRVSGALVVSEDSRIDVSGKGYLPGRTLGNTTNGASTFGAGGSYGGLGGNSSGNPNPRYGDYAEPEFWGSGSLESAGGGLVSISAAVFHLNGQLLANGDNSCVYGAGAGGGIRIYTGFLAGEGSIQASGGEVVCTHFNSRNGGGGGRIAIYANNYSDPLQIDITASGGDGGRAGSPGTVHVIKGTSHTHIRSFHPAGLNGGLVGNELPGLTNRLGYLSNVFDALVLTFNRSIDTNSFLAPHASLLGPAGQIRLGDFQEISNRTYRISIPRQSQNGVYRFSLLPSAIRDTEGFPLDQDADGQPGEFVDDSYQFTIVLDTILPRVAQHTPMGDIAGTITNVDLWFSETIDTPTFTSDAVRILNPTNGYVNVESVTNVGFNRFRISFQPQSLTGYYHLLIGKSITDLAGNNLNPVNSVPLEEGVAYDASFNLVPVDLELNNLFLSTNTFWTGDPVSITWSGRNVTGAGLLGSWIDAVYLSPDPFWNITDKLLGTVQHNDGLATNETYIASQNFNVPGVTPGNYYLIVRADIGNQTRETVETNNLVSYGPILLTVRELGIGGLGVSGLLTPEQRLKYYAIHVPAGESLRLTLSAPGGVNHLFASSGSIPTRLNADIAGTASSSGQTITLSGVPGGGTYYVVISAEQMAGGGNAYTLIADTAPFFVNGISPNQAVGGRSPRFWVTTQQATQPAAILSGVGFDRGTAVEFVGSNGVVRAPDQIHFVSPNTLSLRMSLETWQPGVYSVLLTKGINRRVLTNAFTVTPGGEPKLDVRIIGSSLGVGGGQTLYVEYANTGSRPMPAPLLKVTAYTNAVIVTQKLNRRPQDALNPPNWSSGGGGGGGGGRGGGNIPSYRFRVGVPLYSAQAMAVGPGSNPGLLQPGERGRIPIYFEGLFRDDGAASIEFSVGSLTADDTTIQDCGSPAPGVPVEYKFPRHGQRRVGPGMNATNVCPEQLFTPDWHDLEVSSRPETVDPTSWNAVWQNVVAGSGPLWADYLLMLGDNMNHLAKVGQATNDPAVLFNFEVLQATGALNPVRTLAGSVDVSTPSPGFPLVFRRVFGQPILSRYKLGPLGRGWSHNWDLSVQGLETFSGAVIHGPGGADRFFGRYNNNTFTATGSDTGTLILTNNVFRLTEADGTIWHFSGPENKVGYVEDSNGNRITCSYTGAQLTSLTHSGGKQLLFQYNGTRLSRIIDPLGPGAADDRITTYEYDSSSEHLIRVTAPGARVTAYSYHTMGIPQRLHALTSVTHPDQTQDLFAYDDQGRLIQTSQNCCDGAQQVSYGYDSAGTVTVTDATGRATQLLYGLGGQLAQVRDGEGRIVSFSFNDIAQLTQLLGPGGERYRYSYDSLGNLSGIADPLNQNSTFGYEPNFNRLTQVRDARGNDLKYSYDPRGNLVAIIYADNTRELFAYDGRGNVITSTNRRGSVITYTYSAGGQLASKDYSTTPGIMDFTYSYDSAGNLTNATYWNPQLATHESLNLQYDPFTDRLTRIDYPGGRFFTFEYDPAGRRTRRTDQEDHVTAYLYDALGRLSRMTNEMGHSIVSYEYDPAGRLSRKVLGNGVFTTYAYNAAGQIVELINRKADRQILSSFIYTYDASGRRASMTTLAGTETYGYDPLGQLTRVTYHNGRIVNYAYDPAGNRTQVIDNGAPTAYSANTLNQYTSVGGTNYTFDLDGNLFAEFTTNNGQNTTNKVYAYDIENRLTAVTTPTDTWSYTYDALGNRVAAKHNSQTTRYVIDPTGLGNVAAEYDGDGSLIARYEHGFGLLARSDAAGNPAFYTFSAIGHTSELSDPSGAVANRYAYDPFGLSLAKTETIPNPFEFVGEYGVMNEGNGLEFMRARYQIAALGRFSSEDPLGLLGGLNQNLYVRNNPVEERDATGLLSEYSVGISDTTVHGPYSKIRVDNPWSYDNFNRIRFGDNYANDIARYIVSDPYFREEADRRRRGDEIRESVVLAVASAELLAGAGWRVAAFELAPGLPDWLKRFVRDPKAEPVHPEDQQKSQVFRPSDPNDKLGPSGYGSGGYLPVGSTMPYQVRFENKPSATAPAQRVTVTDTLDPNLDLSTFELTEIAFANQLVAVPAGLNHYETRLAFTVTNQTLLPLGDATAFALVPPPTNSIIVEVDARLDLPTRLLTLTLTTFDPLTGWYPENPLLGILYPNDTNHIGEGTISYLIRAKSNLVSGTVITNRADIIFDYNDPIITPLISNTLDSVPPTSAVAPLPAEAGPGILVQWSGLDDAGGSGVASYDVYVIADGTNQFRWLEKTTDTSAWWSGTPGSTYAFYSVARDNVGHEESAPSAPDSVVTVPTNAPVLFDITSRVADVGNVLIITNRVSGTARGTFTFSLAQPAPFGATINPTNGVLRWTPNCSQASRTHTITVLVTDTGNPNLRDRRDFIVTTHECVVPELGRIVLQAGESGRVPVNLISTGPLTRLEMTVETDIHRLVDLWIEPIVPQICSNSISSTGNSQHLIQFTTCPGTSLIGTQQIAWLHFTTVSNQTSAFVGLQLGNTIGFATNGEEVRNFEAQSGRVVVVGEEPLLEAFLTSNSRPGLILYGRPGPGYSIESKAFARELEQWGLIWQGEQTNLFQEIPPPFRPTFDRTMFFRAHREVSRTARLGTILRSSGQMDLVLFGNVGERYQVEASSDLSANNVWTSFWRGELTSGSKGIPVALTNRMQYFRLLVE